MTWDICFAGMNISVPLISRQNLKSPKMIFLQHDWHVMATYYILNLYLRLIEDLASKYFKFHSLLCCYPFKDNGSNDFCSYIFLLLQLRVGVSRLVLVLFVQALESEVLSFTHLYSLKTKSPQCHYVVTLWDFRF